MAWRLPKFLVVLSLAVFVASRAFAFESDYAGDYPVTMEFADFEKSIPSLGWPLWKRLDRHANVFALLNDDGTYEFVLKVYWSIESSRFQALMDLQERAARYGLSPTLLAGALNVGERTFLFYISPFIETSADCVLDSSAKENLIRTLGELNIAHSDLDFGSNILCTKGGGIQVIDFDLAEDLSAESSDIRSFKIELELFCTVGRIMSPKSMSKLSKADFALWYAFRSNPNFDVNKMLEICTSRKICKDPKSLQLMRAITPSYACR